MPSDSSRASGAPLRRVIARLEEVVAERAPGRPGVRMYFRPASPGRAHGGTRRVPVPSAPRSAPGTFRSPRSDLPVASPDRPPSWVGLLGVEILEDFADLGAFPAGSDLSIPVALGVGRVLRILRAARIAAPGDPLALVGREELAARLLRRAVGRPLRLTLRRRSRLRFLAWTEDGLQVAEDLLDVREAPDAYLAYPARGGAPLRFARDEVVRVSREFAPWFEVVEVERAWMSAPPRRR